MSWRPWPFANASLCGHAEVDFWGWTIREIPVFRRADGTHSAGAPSLPLIGADGAQKLDAQGKKQFAQVMSFDRDGKERWTRAVLASLHAGGIEPS